MDSATYNVPVTDLITAWVNGNRSWVISNLANRHPAITAFMIVEGSTSGELDRSDCNSITNLLMDNFTETRGE